MLQFVCDIASWTFRPYTFVSQKIVTMVPSVIESVAWKSPTYNVAHTFKGFKAPNKKVVHGAL